MDSSALKWFSFRRSLYVLAVFIFWASVALGASEEFGGVGLQVVPVSSGELVVLAVVDKTPAFFAGVRPGDLIVEIDGYPLRGSNFKEVVPRRLWGKPGTAVTLKLLRPGEEGARQTVLRRVSMNPRVKDVPGVKMITPSPRGN